jgi:hypothetical protein
MDKVPHPRSRMMGRRGGVATITFTLACAMCALVGCAGGGGSGGGGNGGYIVVRLAVFAR